MLKVFVYILRSISNGRRVLCRFARARCVGVSTSSGASQLAAATNAIPSEPTSHSNGHANKLHCGSIV